MCNYEIKSIFYYAKLKNANLIVSHRYIKMCCLSLSYIWLNELYLSMLCKQPIAKKLHRVLATEIARRASCFASQLSSLAG